MLLEELRVENVLLTADRFKVFKRGSFYGVIAHSNNNAAVSFRDKLMRICC